MTNFGRKILRALYLKNKSESGSISERRKNHAIRTKEKSDGRISTAGVLR